MGDKKGNRVHFLVTRRETKTMVVSCTECGTILAKGIYFAFVECVYEGSEQALGPYLLGVPDDGDMECICGTLIRCLMLWSDPVLADNDINAWLDDPSVDRITRLIEIPGITSEPALI